MKNPEGGGGRPSYLARPTELAGLWLDDCEPKGIPLAGLFKNSLSALLLALLELLPGPKKRRKKHTEIRPLSFIAHGR